MGELCSFCSFAPAEHHRVSFNTTREHVSSQRATQTRVSRISTAKKPQTGNLHKALVTSPAAQNRHKNSGNLPRCRIASSSSPSPSRSIAHYGYNTRYLRPTTPPPPLSSTPSHQSTCNKPSPLTTTRICPPPPHPLPHPRALHPLPALNAPNPLQHHLTPPLPNHPIHRHPPPHPSRLPRDPLSRRAPPHPRPRAADTQFY